MGNKIGYQQALMKNFENIGKEEVAVIHSAFGDKPHVVAFVKVDKTLSDEDKCEQAFKLTNTIEQGWWHNEGVQYVGPNKTCRSTSSGDQVLLKDGTKYNCSMIGWEKV